MKVLWFVRNQADYQSLLRSLQSNLEADFAICATNTFSWAKKNYPSPKNHHLFFFCPENALEDHYAKGELSYSFLKKDLASMEKAIQDYQPDCCISLGRYAAFVVTSLYHIPLYFLQERYLEKLHSDHNLFRGLNRLFRENRLEQIFQYQDLRKLGIYFSFDIPGHLLKVQNSESFISTNKVLLERGTDYEKILTSILDQYRFLEPGQILFYKAPLVIHQENIYLYQTCKQAGIPQLILPKKKHIPYSVGLCLEKEECHLDQLQEAIHYALNSRKFHTKALQEKEKTQPLTSLSSLLK